MILCAVMMFCGVATLLVWLAGCRDASRDPRLTTLALGMAVLLPLLVACLPKWPVLPLVTLSPGDGTQALPWVTVLWCVWLLGFMVALLRLGFAMRGLGRWRACSWHLAWVDPNGRVGDTGVELRCLRGLRGPVAAGVWKKVVFVPESWNEWNVSTQRIVLDHELMHHRRRDPLWRWVAELACVVHWFNPMVIWMARRLALQCEFACDAAVLRQGVTVRDYAAMLCDFAEEQLPSGPVLAMADRSSLELRVRQMAKPAASVSVWLLGCFIALTLASAVALAWMGPRQMQPPKAEVFSPEEVATRWSADPFPAEH